MLVAPNKGIISLSDPCTLSHRVYHCFVSRLQEGKTHSWLRTEVTLVTRLLGQGDVTWTFLGKAGAIKFSFTLVCIRGSSPFGPERLTLSPAFLFALGNYKILWFTRASWSKAGLEFAFQMHYRWFTSILLYKSWQQAQEKLNHIILRTNFNDCRVDRNFGPLG